MTILGSIQEYVNLKELAKEHVFAMALLLRPNVYMLIEQELMMQLGPQAIMNRRFKFKNTSVAYDICYEQPDLPQDQLFNNIFK